MTVQNTANVAQFNGDGINKAFPFTFRFFKNTDLVVIKTNAGGTVTPLNLNVDYSVSGAGSLTGGTVTVTAAPLAGETLMVMRELDLVQLTDLRNQGRFYPEVHENVFDYLTMLLQQISESNGRALRRPRGKQDFDAEGRRITNLQDARSGSDAATLNNVTSAVNSAVRAEEDARAAADANIQQQLGGQIPLESSAFSPISWHDQEISNSVNIPAGVNAWSFGPEIQIDQGQIITIGEGSSWTVADGEEQQDTGTENWEGTRGNAVPIDDRSPKMGLALPSSTNKLSDDVSRIISSFTSIDTRLGDYINLRAFGAKGDGTTDDTESIVSAIQFAQQSGRAIYAPAGVYVVTKRIPITATVRIYGDGFCTDVNNSRPDVKTLMGTVFLAKGTALRDVFVLGVTDERTSGGVVANPDADFGATDASYALASYYNEDANTTTGAAATPRPVSVLMHVGIGVSGCVFQDFIIVLNFNGIDGYKNKTLTLADNWDIGLYLDNARYNECRNIHTYGYWRINGLLIRAGALAREVPSSTYAGAEENKFYNCTFQGWKGIGLRGIGVWYCKTVTTTYIEIPWAANHPFDISVVPRITRSQYSPKNFGVTAAAKVGDSLRLTLDTDPTAWFSVGDEVLPLYVGNGVSGTVFHDCRSLGMWHTSERRISDPAITGAMAPSACLEISGARIRGPRFEGTKLQTVDDILVHLHQCIDVILGPNARFEGATPSANGAAGGRCITTPTDRTAYPYLVGGTFRVQLQMEQNAGDFTPSFGSLPAKFTLPGFWVPNICGETFHGGLLIGGNTALNYMREYYNGGWTTAVSLETAGDTVVNGVTRASTYDVAGEYLRFNLHISARITFTTGSGNLRVSLPVALNNTNNLRAVFSCAYEGITLPAGYTNIVGELLPGSNLIQLVATGSGKARTYVNATHIVSGAFVVLSISGAYKVARS